MPADDNDWRLQGQETYLTGAALTFRHYQRWSPTWEHDHCEFCWATFYVEHPAPGDLSEGYCTLDEYRWICPTCFEDFKNRFEWTVVSVPTFRVLPGLPPYGPPAIPFPPALVNTGKEGFVVEFLPETPDAWVGNFWPGLGEYQGMHVHPDGRHVIVFVGGTGYVIDAEARRLHSTLEGAIAGVWKLANPVGLLCNRHGLAFFRIGPEGLVWHTRRLACEGFKDIVFTPKVIRGLAFTPDGDRWVPFEVDLATGRAEGGARTVAVPGWERLAGPA